MYRITRCPCTMSLETSSTLSLARFLQFFGCIWRLEANYYAFALFEHCYDLLCLYCYVIIGEQLHELAKLLALVSPYLRARFIPAKNTHQVKRLLNQVPINNTLSIGRPFWRSWAYLVCWILRLGDHFSSSRFKRLGPSSFLVSLVHPSSWSLPPLQIPRASWSHWASRVLRYPSSLSMVALGLWMSRMARL
jgi:hypothetical protein